MKSKKVIFGIALVAILVIGGIIFSLSSKDSTTTPNESAKNTESTTNSDTTQTTNEENSNTDTIAEANSNDETTNNPATNNETTTESSNGDFSSKDAANTIVKFYLGEENITDQKLIPISLENNVAKKQDNSNTFYSDKEDLTDSTNTGLIIILDNYDEASKSYKYTLKDYYTIKDGENLGTGTVSNDGSVTED